MQDWDSNLLQELIPHVSLQTFTGGAVPYLSGFLREFWGLDSDKEILLTDSDYTPVQLLREVVPGPWVNSALARQYPGITPSDVDHNGYLDPLFLPADFSGLIVSSYGGNVPDITQYSSLTEKLVLDLGDIFYAEYQDQVIYNFGLASTVSFESHRPWGISGGGALICDRVFAKVCRRLVATGTIGRPMSEFGACAILATLTNFESFISTLQELREMFLEKVFEKVGLIDSPVSYCQGKMLTSVFAVRFNCNISPYSFPGIPCYWIGSPKENFPRAKAVHSCTLGVPLQVLTTEEQVEEIVSTFSAYSA